MAISVTTIGNRNSSTDAVEYGTSATVTPTNGDVVVMDVYNAKGTTPDIPVPAGLGISAWTLITGGLFNANQKRLARFWGHEATYTPSLVTVTFGGNTQIGCILQVYNVNGLDTTNPFPKSDMDTGTGSNATCSFTTESATGNGQLLVGAFAASEAGALDSNYLTLLAQSAGGSPVMGMVSGWTTASLATGEVTWTTSVTYRGIMTELGAASSGGGVVGNSVALRQALSRRRRR